MISKFRKWLSDVLLELDFIILSWSARLYPDIDQIKEPDYKVPQAPHSFSSFKEGMSSPDYCTRHDAASKLVGWYLYQNGHPLVEELVKAAVILLEDTPATSGDVSFLVGAWKDQASATTDADRENAEQREDKIYSDLAFKAAETIKLSKETQNGTKNN